MSVDHPSETFCELLKWPGYRVSDWGRVQSRRSRNGKGSLKDEWHDLKLQAAKDAFYVHVLLHNGSGNRLIKNVNILVLEAFIGPCPPGMECRHLDGNPRNNRLDNLQWGTRQENAEDRRRHGTMFRGERHNKATINEPIVRLIRRLSREGMQPFEIYRMLGCSKRAVLCVINNKTWKHVTI